MDGFSLPPDLEQFAADEVAAGHYRDTAEVVRAGFELLKRRQNARTEFIKTLEDAEAEADRDGWFSVDQVSAELDTLIEQAARRHA